MKTITGNFNHDELGSCRLTLQLNRAATGAEVFEGAGSRAPVRPPLVYFKS
jgi:hypothetical protein